jgi:hypothetical protein
MRLEAVMYLECVEHEKAPPGSDCLAGLFVDGF